MIARNNFSPNLKFHSPSQTPQEMMVCESLWLEGDMHRRLENWMYEIR